MKGFSSWVRPNRQSKTLSKQEQHEDKQFRNDANFELVQQQSFSKKLRLIVDFTPLKVD